MIPKVARKGASFKNAANYYLHDKGSSTQDRVEWTQTRNLLTDDPDKAWKVMAWTAKHNEDLKKASGARLTGKKLKNPVFSFSLSWHPEQQPDKEEMIRAADEAMDFLGLSEHEAFMVAHNDEEHRHVHVIANTVHPETGLVQDIKYDKRKFSAWALKYEQRNGKIYCPQRAENNERRKEEMSKPKEKRQDVRYKDPVIQTAWERSDSGKAFSAALNESGYHLANGNKRLVVVDRWGKAQNPVRQLEGVKTKDFNARMADLDRTTLPQAAELQASIRKQMAADYRASRSHDQWAGNARHELYARQTDEKLVLGRQQSDERHQKEVELKQFYKTDAKLAEIKDLEGKLKESPTLLSRLTGRRKQLEEEVKVKRKEMENIQQRMKEQRDKLKKEHDRKEAEFKERHQKQDKMLEERIAAKKPERYQEEREQSPSPARSRRSRSQDGSGRTLSR